MGKPIDLTLESDIQPVIVKTLEMAGFWVIRTQVRGRTGPRSVATGERGMPDLLLVGLGHLETKKSDGELSPAQKLWHEKAKRRGVNVGTARTANEALKLAREWESKR